MSTSLGLTLRGVVESRHCTSSTAVICAICTFCAILPLSISQLVFAISIAVAYALWQEFRGVKVQAKSEEYRYTRRACVHPPKKALQPIRSQLTHSASHARHASCAQLRSPERSTGVSCLDSSGSQAASSQHSIAARVEQLPVPGIRTQMRRDTWEKEVDVLLASISQSAASIRMVKELARSVQQTVRSTLPEAEVVGVASGDLVGRCSMGMGDPEVDLVVFVNPNALPSHLKCRLARSGIASPAQLDSRKVQKSAIRACTDRLVSVGGFKFRRSAFRGQEPKVTLLAPASFSSFPSLSGRSGTKGDCAGDDVVGTPVDLSVNTLVPLYGDALQMACGRCDHRAKELISLVRRWARDRGISHEAKGHLSSYSWSLLAAFFLQVTSSGDGPILPALEGIQVDKSNVIVQRAAPIGASDTAHAEALGRRGKAEHKSVSLLFIEFVHFYSKEFNWRSEAVSVRAGRRAVPDLSLPLHIVISTEGVPTQVGPHIEDLFDPKNNLGTSMTAEGFARLQEELSRAWDIFTRESPEPSLTELIEPWIAPNASADLEGDVEAISMSHRGSEASMISQCDRQALLIRGSSRK